MSVMAMNGRSKRVITGTDMIGIYHDRDLDGITSGAIIKYKYPHAKIIGYDYGNDFNYDISGEPIIMADVSMPMPQMNKLAKESNWQMTWIDHHISAITDYEKYVGKGQSFCNAILNNEYSACEGVWRYLFPEIEVPRAVKLLSEYDTWKNSDKQRWNNEILPFQFGMRVHCNSVESFPVEVFKNDDIIDLIIQHGLIVLKYQSQVNETQCKKASFEVEFEGLRAICLNGGGFNSDVFKSVYDESKHDIMMPFQYDGRKWTISLYSTKPEIDCSVIAKKYGGGGHKQASGFQIDDIEKIIKEG